MYPLVSLRDWGLLCFSCPDASVHLIQLACRMTNSSPDWQRCLGGQEPTLPTPGGQCLDPHALPVQEMEPLLT